jgi:hypothetical protein
VKSGRSSYWRRRLADSAKPLLLLLAASEARPMRKEALRRRRGNWLPLAASGAHDHLHIAAIAAQGPSHRRPGVQSELPQCHLSFLSSIDPTSRVRDVLAWPPTFPEPFCFRSCKHLPVHRLNRARPHSYALPGWSLRTHARTHSRTHALRAQLRYVPF